MIEQNVCKLKLVKSVFACVGVVCLFNSTKKQSRKKNIQSTYTNTQTQIKCMEFVMYASYKYYLYFYMANEGQRRLEVRPYLYYQQNDVVSLSQLHIISFHTKLFNYYYAVITAPL